MRSAEYDIVCSWDKAAEEDVDWGDATLADVEVASLEEVASGGCVDEVFVMDGDICDFCFVLLLIWSIALFLVVILSQVDDGRDCRFEFQLHETLKLFRT